MVVMPLSPDPIFIWFLRHFAEEKTEILSKHVCHEGSCVLSGVFFNVQADPLKRENIGPIAVQESC